MQSGGEGKGRRRKEGGLGIIITVLKFYILNSICRVLDAVGGDYRELRLLDFVLLRFSKEKVERKII